MSIKVQVEGSKKPIFSWCPSIDSNALDQMIKIAQLPFVEHCAVMPDAHLGQNCCIGGVVATVDVVVPDFCGVDGGCGVIVLKTSLKREDLLDVSIRQKIHSSVCRGIPMGFNHNHQNAIKEHKIKYEQKIEYLIEKSGILDVEFEVLQNNEKSIWEQLGTLGGGNHFCSVEYDENDNVWIMIHSGSRNIGLKVADYFNKIAIEKNKEWYSVDTFGVPFLPVSSKEGKGYLAWLDFALRFAHMNRFVMAEEIKKDISHLFPNVEFDDANNIHHNYVAQENHFGRNVWVHRKGAILAREGSVGIIPGSMGTASYITEGKGNEESLMSSSHGAGRVKGRKVFNVENSTEDGIRKIRESMEGVVYSKFVSAKSRKGQDMGMLDVSEAPAAYKNIEEVMKNQEDLVSIKHKLLPLINWKDQNDVE